MHILPRQLLLLIVGLALAYVGMLLIGWFAAIAWDRDTYLQVANTPVLGFLVLSVAMAALPVALLATVTGFMIARVAKPVDRWSLSILTLPWLALLLLPTASDLNISIWITRSFGDAHTVLVLLALPIGLLLGFRFARSHTRSGAA